jgi:LacI family transcriptional regulator
MTSVRGPASGPLDDPAEAPPAGSAETPGALTPAITRAIAPTGDGGGSPVTLYDVARLAGVSTATVSRVVHGLDRVRESTRIRVTRVIEELGYVPDGAAQSLSRRRKDVIGLVCVERRAKQYDIENMNLLYYDEILHGVEARIRDHGSWSLLITFLQEDEANLARLQSLSGKVDGLLIGEGIVSSDLLARLGRRVPLVVIGGDPAERSTDVVTAHNRAGSVALINHLIDEHGVRRLFHVDGPAAASDARERRIALDMVLRAHRDRAHRSTELIGSCSGQFSVQSGEDAGEFLLARHGDALPDAVVCSNDQMAIGVLQALARADVKVPEQVKVVGFDDIYPGSLSHPPLTTVHQPMGLIGERACARLLDRIADPSLSPKVEMLPTELVLRSSCGCPPGTARRLPVRPLRGRSSPTAHHLAVTTLHSASQPSPRSRGRATPDTRLIRDAMPDARPAPAPAAPRALLTPEPDVLITPEPDPLVTPEPDVLMTPES